MSVCRPFIDFLDQQQAIKIASASDASLNPLLGTGGYYLNHWFAHQYPPGFIQQATPSIQFVELLAVTGCVQLWGHLFQNKRVILSCDNQAVVQMINEGVSADRKCMALLRIIVFDSMQYYFRLFAEWISTKDNWRADYLSRMQAHRVRAVVGSDMDTEPTTLPPTIWPVSVEWYNSL